MISDIQNEIPDSSNSPTNTPSTPSSVHNQTNVTQPSSSNQTTGTKKKKKKKAASAQLSPLATEATQPQSQSTSNSSSPTNASQPNSPNASNTASPNAANTDSWQQRVQSLRNSLNKAREENQLLASDLAAALARASDAEHAEDTVNKGLLTARSVISQRDRVIAELKSTSSNLRADLTQLQEEKKKTDKRLILLKTVSANLQEARENRDLFEKKLDDANGEISNLRQKNESLGKDIESLKQQVEAMEMVKQQLARQEIEVEELSRAKVHAEEAAHRSELRAFTIGAASVFAIGTIFRVLGKGRSKDRE